MYTKMLEKRAILSADNPGRCVASESYKEDTLSSIIPPIIYTHTIVIVLEGTTSINQLNRKKRKYL